MHHHLLRHRHTILLVVLLVMLVVQPLTHELLYGLMLFDGLLTIMSVAVLTIVFERRREQLIALSIAVPTIAGNLLAYGLPEPYLPLALVAWHGLLVVYLGFAMIVILRDVFRRSTITSDALIGVLCGYIISGVAWGNLYLITSLLIPDAFHVDPMLESYLATIHGKRFIFNDYSFVTLTSLGTSGLKPLHPFTNALTWIEAMFGQFYLAIVVAQLVGMKLASKVNH